VLLRVLFLPGRWCLTKLYSIGHYL